MIKATRLALAFLALLALTGRTAAQSETYYSYYDQRVAARQQLRTVEQYHLGKALADIDGGLWELALSECDFILRYFPDHPRGLNLMAETARKLNKLDVAESYFDRAIQLFPQSATTYAAYGIFKYRIGQLEESAQALKRSVTLIPDYAEAHYNLGLVYADLKQLDKANVHAQAAYRLGYPLPGLQQVLKRADAWATLTEQELAAALAAD